MFWGSKIQQTFQELFLFRFLSTPTQDMDDEEDYSRCGLGTFPLRYCLPKNGPLTSYYTCWEARNLVGEGSIKFQLSLRSYLQLQSNLERSDLGQLPQSGQSRLVRIGFPFLINGAKRIDGSRGITLCLQSFDMFVFFMLLLGFCLDLEHYRKDIRFKCLVNKGVYGAARSV